MSEGCEVLMVLVILLVGGDVSCKVFFIIMLNGDGINDVFIVFCLLDE